MDNPLRGSYEPLADSEARLIVARYYSEVVEPERRALLETRGCMLKGVGDPMQSAVDELISLTVRHHRSERATLTYTAWLMAGGDPESRLPARVAIASELFHRGGLIHDDIVDGGTTRDWQPSTWAQYAALHASQRWASQFGHSVAIWLGNLLYFWSHDVFAEALLDVPTEAANHARDVWTRALTKVWASQHLDLLESAHGSSAQSVDSARTVARLKGRYAAATPLQLGAALAGGSKSLDQALARFGEPLGEAYILRNDLEGVFGDASTIDAYPKDLQERRLSTLVAIAMKRATPAQNDILKDVGSPDLSEVQMNEIKEVLEATGARAETERLSENLATQALDAAGADDFPGWAQQIFASIVNAIMKIHSIE